MPSSSDRPLTRIDAQSRRHPGTIGSHAGIGIHPHIYNSDNPGTNTDIIRVDTSPHGACVETPTPSAGFLIGHGWYVESAPPREDIGSHARSRGRSTSLKLSSTGRKPSFLGLTPPCTVRKRQSRRLIADWFELHSAVLGG